MLSETEKALAFFAAVGILSILTIIYKLSHFSYPYIRTGSLEKYNNEGGAWALVTGSSDGIGQAIVHELCSKGFNIILHGRNATKLSPVQGESINIISKYPISHFHSRCRGPYLGQIRAIQDFIASIKDLKLTVLVNNVGGTATLAADFLPFKDHTTKEIDDLILINMLFATHLTHALLPLLTQQPAALILNTGSASHTGLPYMAVYSATKGYLSAWGML